jgi:glycosyltransferase involved in cell wall biosynthesis
VPPADPGALTAALHAVLADPARAREMGARGRARVGERFLWSQVAERLEDGLSGVVAPRPRGAAA